MVETDRFLWLALVDDEVMLFGKLLRNVLFPAILDFYRASEVQCG